MDVVLSDGDLMDLGAGVKLRVIHWPRHTPGHVAYWWEEEGVLLTGDAIQREIALGALAELVYEIPQLRIRRTGMPVLPGPTLWAYIECAMAGAYPG